MPKADPPPADQEELRQELAQIEALPIYKRTHEHWHKLARGYARLGQHEQSVKAYRAVLSKRRSLRNDPILLADLRRAAEDEHAYKVVVNLCETVLGKPGKDLLYDIWLGTRSNP